MTIIRIIASCASMYFITGILSILLNMSVCGWAYGKARNVSFIDGFIATGDAIGFMRMVRGALLWPDVWHSAWSMYKSWDENDVDVTTSDLAEMIDTARSENL